MGAVALALTPALGGLIPSNPNMPILHLCSCQVVDPLSGVALAQTPPLAGNATGLTWEYPYMGAPVSRSMYMIMVTVICSIVRQ